MPEAAHTENRLASAPDSGSRARDHLANERTFLAWVRTGIAIVVFGFAIGRFAIAIRQFMRFEGHAIGSLGATVWFGALAILGGVALTAAGWLRFRHTRAQIEAGSFEPAGLVIDVVGMLVVLFGLALGAYLVYIQMQL